MRVSSVTRAVVVRNKQGLHARPARLIVDQATRFSARVEIVRGGQRINAKSILDIMTLGATHGTQLLLEAEGDDADHAVQTLAVLIESELDQDATPGPADGAPPAGYDQKSGE